jgi:hypothetical protein
MIVYRHGGIRIRMQYDDLHVLEVAIHVARAIALCLDLARIRDACTAASQLASCRSAFSNLLVDAHMHTCRLQGPLADKQRNELHSECVTVIIFAAGYTGRPRIQCGAAIPRLGQGGVWETDVVGRCIKGAGPVTCPVPPEGPTNGKFPASCTDSLVGVNCTATCNAGYTSKPEPVITCRGDGTWSGISGTCQQGVSIGKWVCMVCRSAWCIEGCGAVGLWGCGAVGLWGCGIGCHLACHDWLSCGESAPGFVCPRDPI